MFRKSRKYSRRDRNHWNFITRNNILAESTNGEDCKFVMLSCGASTGAGKQQKKRHINAGRLIDQKLQGTFET